MVSEFRACNAAASGVEIRDRQFEQCFCFGSWVHSGDGSGESIPLLRLALDKSRDVSSSIGKTVESGVGESFEKNVVVWEGIDL